MPLAGYGGIERICQDLLEEFIFNQVRGFDADMYCTPKTVGSLPLKPYPENAMQLDTGQDLVLDFTHQKLGKFTFDKKRYIAMCVLTDDLSNVNDVFQSKAVARGFGKPDGKVVYAGIQNRFHYSKDKGGYLLFFGKMTRIKRPDIAIMAARRAQRTIVLAGTTGRWAGDAVYIDSLRAQADGDRVRLVEDPDEEKKIQLFAHADALIMPSQWSQLKPDLVESFGLVAVEALMSGLPVITSGDGGLSEIVTPQTGFVCTTLGDYARAIEDIPTIDPRECVARGSEFTSAKLLDSFVAYWKESQR